MIIETQRMILRPPKIEDAESLCDSLDDNVVKWLAFIPKFTIESAERAISKIIMDTENGIASDYTFHIELKENNKMIGVVLINKVVLINNIDKFDKSCKLVYWLNSKYQRRGLISEALKKIIEFCYIDMQLQYIETEIFSDNIASIELVKKLGFRLKCIKDSPVKCLSTDKIHSCCIYVLSAKNKTE